MKGTTMILAALLVATVFASVASAHTDEMYECDGILPTDCRICTGAGSEPPTNGEEHLHCGSWMDCGERLEQIRCWSYYVEDRLGPLPLSGPVLP